MLDGGPLEHQGRRAGGSGSQASSRYENLRRAIFPRIPTSPTGTNHLSCQTGPQPETGQQIVAAQSEAVIDKSTRSAQFLVKVNPKANKRIAQLQTTHVPPNQYLERLKKVDSTRCSESACSASKKNRDALHPYLHKLRTKDARSYNKQKRSSDTRQNRPSQKRGVCSCIKLSIIHRANHAIVPAKKLFLCLHTTHRALSIRPHASRTNLVRAWLPRVSQHAQETAAGEPAHFVRIPALNDGTEGRERVNLYFSI